MDDSILVPTDGSDPATAALEHALDVAADTGATVHALYVANTNEPSLVRLGDQVVDVLEEEGEEVLDRARSLAEERGVTLVDRVVQGDPPDAILEYVDAADVGLVVMGAHGRRGLGEYLLGSTTEAVVNACAVPVLTVRAGEDVTRSYPYEGVLVPTDDSPHARGALEVGASIAARCGATLHLLFVVDELPETIDPRTTPLSEEARQRAEAALDEAASRTDFEDENVVTAIKAGSVPHQITSYAESHAVDLVVMGTHGWSAFDRYLLGSFTDRVIRTAPVPVLTTTSVVDDSTT